MSCDCTVVDIINVNNYPQGDLTVGILLPYGAGLFLLAREHYELASLHQNGALTPDL